MAPAIGSTHEVVIGPIAHGGHAIAHADGATLLVRHALPGERVVVRVTETGRRVTRADAIEVLEASAARVVAPCAWSVACGGCDFQHVRVSAQRDLKRDVLIDALVRFGGMSRADLDVLGVVVDELPGHPDGLRWRTRMRWALGSDRRLGLRGHRSHDVIAVDGCLIARPEVDVAALGRPPRGASEVVTAVGSDGRARAIATGGRDEPASGRVRQVVGGREWRVDVDGFWQVHPALADTLQRTVVELGAPSAGESWWDLYSGAGVLAAAVADAVGATGTVVAVESDAAAVAAARRALHDVRQVDLVTADVRRWVAEDRAAPDGIVLDPPRSGAGLDVAAALGASGTSRIVYVACDPVALGRDIKVLRSAGFAVTALRAFDAFPMTHHLEAVVRLDR